MIMVRAIIRPERTGIIMAELASAGFPAVTKIDVVGRGKQRGINVGEIVYDEIPKEMLLIVCQDEEGDDLISIISKYARTGEQGAFGDGKIFVTPVIQAYTVSSGQASL